MKNEMGFSLVEVLVAFVILSLTVITSLSIYADNLSRIASIENRINNLDMARSAFSGSATCANVDGIRRSAIASPTVDWTNYKAYACSWQGPADEKPIVTIVVEADKQ